jgi:hypothetical protein
MNIQNEDPSKSKNEEIKIEAAAIILKQHTDTAKKLNSVAVVAGTGIFDEAELTKNVMLKIKKEIEGETRPQRKDFKSSIPWWPPDPWGG